MNSISKYMEDFNSLVPRREIDKLLDMARSLDVSTREGLEQAASLLSASASYAEIVDKFWGPIEEAAYNAWKTIKAAADSFRSIFSQDSKFRENENNIRGVLEPKILQLEEIPQGIKGLHFRVAHEATVTDFKALVKACASGKAPLDLLQPNMKALNKLASAMSSSPYPGVEFSEKKSLVVSKA